MDDIGAIQLAVKVDYTQLTGLIKTTDQTKRAVGLLAKDFARTGDKSQYMSSINKIVRAQNNLSKTSRMSQSAIMSLGSKVVQQTKYTDSLTIATRRLNAAQMASGKAMGNTKNKMNGSNMAVQQLGYQFGDFAVQVQGGTSAFVAFSQQASQLVGVLPMIAGPLGLSMGAAVGLSAALGILIPVGSAVARMFFEMKDGADKASKGIKTYEERLKSAKDATKALVQELEKLKGGFVDLHELTLSQQLSQESSKLALLEKDKLELAKKGNRAYKGQLAAINTQIKNQEKVIELAKEELKTYKELVKEKADFAVRSKSMESLSSSRSLGSSSKNPFSSIYQGALELSNETYKNEEKLIALRKENMDSLSKSASVIPSAFSTGFKGAMQGVAEVAEARTKRLNKLFAGMQGRRGAIAPSKTDVALMGMGGVKADVQELAKAQKLLDKINKDLDRSAQIQSKKNQLSEIELKYGKESTTYKYTQKQLSDLEFQISQDILKEKLTTQGVDQNAIILAMALNAQEHELLERRKKLSQISYGLMEGSDAAQRLGKYGGRGTTSDRDPTMGGVSIYDDPKKTQAQEDADALADYIAQLNHEKTVEGELVGLFGSEREIKQKLLDIQHEYDGIITPSQVKQIENTLKLTDAETKRHDALQKAKEEQEALGASIEASMEKAFMSMIDGTTSVKDAFKAMAADIIKELYRVLVVKKMVSAIGGLFADGGVISNGSQVQAYANGGVVGGPTTFAMSGGKTGLMGEAGPEAIMPLKRGANGKLGVQMEGGGGATTIVQNINVSTGVQQTVRAEIRQMMPQIADSAKGAVLDAKRRGGSYGRAMA